MCRKHQHFHLFLTLSIKYIWYSSKKKVNILYLSRSEHFFIDRLSASKILHSHYHFKDFGTLRGHTIRLAADKYLPMDWSCIPFGNLVTLNSKYYILKVFAKSHVRKFYTCNVIFISDNNSVPCVYTYII